MLFWSLRTEQRSGATAVTRPAEASSSAPRKKESGRACRSRFAARRRRENERRRRPCRHADQRPRLVFVVFEFPFFKRAQRDAAMSTCFFGKVRLAPGAKTARVSAFIVDAFFPTTARSLGALGKRALSGRFSIEPTAWSGNGPPTPATSATPNNGDRMPRSDESRG